MEKTYTYEITENGYKILLNGVDYMVQEEPYIPDPSKTYEENAQAQIAEMQKADAQAGQAQTEEEERLTNIELALAELYESIEGGN